MTTATADFKRHLTDEEITELSIGVASGTLKQYRKKHFWLCSRDCEAVLKDAIQHQGDWVKVYVIKKHSDGSLQVLDPEPILPSLPSKPFDIGGPDAASGIKIRLGQKLEVEYAGGFCWKARTLTRPARWWRM